MHLGQEYVIGAVVVELVRGEVVEVLDEMVHRKFRTPESLNLEKIV
jgi:hypothetical protein